ncbi:MAG: anaerobic ribonucleoside-triphosphate reductase [Actinobacteria bacterium]|nr:MAG: anaerobic ribonucleoside-triphosphate reductase [Actinomycetota bacterium]
MKTAKSTAKKAASSKTKQKRATRKVHIKVIGSATNEGDSTDIALLVSTESKAELSRWDKKRITDSLIRETGTSHKKADEIATAVEEKIAHSNLSTVTTNIIREFVDLELIERGMERHHKKHSHLGIPLYDVNKIISEPNNENSNTTHNPESINLTLAENILKQYALRNVYSPDVAEAHLAGNIHIHDLGFIDRPYCGGHSIEYIKKYGINIPNVSSVSSPARHPEVLVGHMVKFASVLQSHYAGAVGWEAVNVFFAPMLDGLPYEKIKQIAQMLIFEFNQLAGARGSQTVFTDFNLYASVPSHFAKTPAIGPGGKYTGKTYKDYEETAQDFLKALLEVYMKGDASGKTFFFPKPLLHVNDDIFENIRAYKLFQYACDLASSQGITYFVFARGDEVTISQCCRLKLKLEEKDLKETLTPEKMRFTALQNVTINLPRIAYKAEKDEKKLYAELDKVFEYCVKAHQQKAAFIRNLLEMKKEGPLALLANSADGQSYVKFDRLTFLVGILGLNEMVQFHTGKQLHESDEAYRFGLKIIAYMNLRLKKLSEETGMKMVLEETPGESSTYRLAKLDLRKYPKEAYSVIKGDVDAKEFYYTNSIHLAVDAPVDYMERIIKHSKFHPMIEAGAIIHVWLGESAPSKESIANVVKKTHYMTQCAQVCFSPEFTVCERCGKVSRGLFDQCPYCKSEEVYGATRIVGYFSKIPGWNKGKKGELKERIRTNLKVESEKYEGKTVLQGSVPTLSGS